MSRGRREGVRGSVRRLKSGGYQARLPKSIDPAQRPLLPSQIDAADTRRSWSGEAEAWEAIAEAEVLIRRGHLALAAPILAPVAPVAPAPPVRTVSVVAKEFLDFLEQDHAEGTKSDYASCVRSVICSPTRGLPNHVVVDLTREELSAWRSRLRAKKVTPAREETAWAVLSSMLTWEVEENRLSENPALGHQPKRRTKKGKARKTRDNALLMTWDESAPLVFAVDNLEHRLMLLTLMWGGPRASEAAAIDPTDLRPGAQGVHLERVWAKPKGKPWIMEDLKDAEERTIELPTPLVLALGQWAAGKPAPIKGELGLLFRSSAPRRQGTGLMTPGVFKGQVLKTARAKAGLDPNPASLDRARRRGLVIKDLRSYAATMMFDAGATIESVRDNLGHDDISTTMTYYTRAKRENSTDPVRLGIQANTDLTYRQRLDALWDAWVEHYGDPLADLQAYLDTLG